MTTSTALPTGWETSPRAQEMRTYEAHKAELLQTAPGKYALIKDSDVIGLYDDNEGALAEGYRLFRLKGFMVQRVQEELDTFYIGGSALATEGEE